MRTVSRESGEGADGIDEADNMDGADGREGVVRGVRAPEDMRFEGERFGVFTAVGGTAAGAGAAQSNVAHCRSRSVSIRRSALVQRRS